MPLPDFVFSDHGSLWLCEPQTDEAAQHIREHVGEEAQFMGRAVAVEPRYVQSLAQALDADGFTTNI